MRGLVRGVVLVGLLVVVGVLGVGGGVAWGVGGGVVWGVDSVVLPSVFSAGRDGECLGSHDGFLEAAAFCDGFVTTFTDVGGRASSGGVVVLRETLPVGVSVQLVSLLGFRNVVGGSGLQELGGCGVVGRVVSCSVSGRVVEPDGTLKLLVFVTVSEPEPAAGSLVVPVSVEGGGGARVEGSGVVSFGVSAPSFGLTGFSAPFLGSFGVAEVQAGAHPYELPVKLDLGSVVRRTPEGALRATSVQDLRDVIVDLPVGVVGSAVSAPQCTLHELSAEGELAKQGVSACPEDTIVGYLRTFPEGLISAASPLYNIVPEHGVAAEFGFVDSLGDSHVLYASLAPTREGYVLRSTTHEIPQVLLDEVTANVYGDPAARDKSHGVAVPMFTNPEDCTGEPLTTDVYLDSWQNPGSYNADGSPDLSDPAWVKDSATSPPVTGCEALQGLFAPAVEVAAESSRADSPTGLSVDVKVPQQEGVESLGTPPVRETVVTLPAGVGVNPSSANGLGACSEAQIGWLGETLSNFTAAAPACPESSRIGTLEVEAPALPAEACVHPGLALSECPAEAEREKTPLRGSIYVAEPYENPFGSAEHPAGALLAIYLVIDDPRTGVVVKIPAHVEASEATGQLTTTVADTPQFPFSALRTHFFAGNTAALSTPEACGTYTASGVLTPWSAPEPVTSQSSFTVSEAAGGGGCPAGVPFAPSLTAGMASPQAAGFSSFSLTLSREDSDQPFGSVSVTTPPGLAAILKNVVECPEPGASTGDCPAESLIGEATSAVGTGPAPYWVHGGQVYLTGPYNHGPFGLSIVVPTTAGPYTLTGNGGPGREIVRSSIRVNPETAQVTVASDPLPEIIQGIPLHIRTVNVTINHPDFMFNPTSCEQLAVNTSITSAQGATATPSTPFHAAGCTTLPFKPVLSATAAGQGSKQHGTSFDVKITSPGLGQANIHKVDLTIPSILPSRLETIQKACPDTTFDANPSSCDEGSVIGEGIVTTPVFKTPLRGPAYLVSHAAAAFPDVEIVLQGEGVTITLDGKTDIKNKVTYSHFETAPDAPFTTFEANLPQGPHSALTAHVPENQYYNLCYQPPIQMATQITAQNNATITQNTPVNLQGCPTTTKILKHTLTNHKHTLTLTIYTPTPTHLTITTTTTTTPHHTQTTHTTTPL